MQNSQKYTGARSKYKGVSWYKNTSGRCWSAQCRINKQAHYLGSFYTEEEAALAYNKFASANFGQYFKGNTLNSQAEVN